MIRWQVDKERRFPLAARPIPPGSSRSGFPPPWPDRPRTSAAMVASANGVVARAGPGPMTTRCSACWVATTSVRCASPTGDTCVTCAAYGDVAIGAQTLREQPRLLQTPQEPGRPAGAGPLRVPARATACPRSLGTSSIRSAAASTSTLPVFNTPGVEAIVVTTENGAADLLARLRGARPGRGL